MSLCGLHRRILFTKNIDTMISKLKHTIKDFSLIQPSDTVIVALSGGADSVSLLYALHLLENELSFVLRAAHLNHNIRGEEALRDELFCKELCRSLGVPLSVKSVFVAETAEKQKISLELAGRNERYAFFGELSRMYSNVKIATAHTASDNLETVLFNLSRGTGADGLRGIPVRRGNIIRPLITVTREEVEDFCSEHSLSYVTDSTNMQPIYSRNIIRASAVPALRKINPELEDAVLRMSMQMSHISEYLDKQAFSALKSAEVKYGWSCEKFRSSDRILCERMISLLAKKVGMNILEKKHIDLCRQIIYNGGTVSLPNGYCAAAKQGVFRIFKSAKTCGEFIFSLNCDTRFNFAGKEYVFSFYKNPPENSENLIPLINTDGLFIRNRRPGDTFRIHGRNVTKSLKKLLNEEKIPAELRGSLLLIEQQGKILWLENVGLSAYAEDIRKNSRLFLKITIFHHINNL